MATHVAAHARMRCGLVVICGPMFSSKTTTLRALIDRHMRANRKCRVYRPSQDVRDGEHAEAAYSHADVFSVRRSMPAEMVACADDVVEQCERGDVDVVAFDEAQFFGDIVDAVDRLAKRKLVYVAGLSSDFRREPFEVISRLIAKADSVMHNTAVCMHCGDNAPFTRRKSSDVDVVVIGDGNIYEPVCRACYDEYESHKE